MSLEGNMSPHGRTVFKCDDCDYKTNNKKDFNKHTLTAKHKLMTDRMTSQRANIPTPTKQYSCSCGKVYTFKQGLFVHRKTCTHRAAEPQPLENTIVFSSAPTKVSDTFKNVFTENGVFVQMLKENNEFKSLIFEQNAMIKNLLVEKKQESNENLDFKSLMIEQRDMIKNLLVEKKEEKHDSKDMINKIYELTQQNLAITTNITNNTINNNNQRFNLNVFLNETCKDAMNLDEFLDTIRPTFDELLVMGDVGFVSGISDIFIKRLRALDITKRPIHCTDAKRETIFLKENNVWTKDDNGHSRLNSIIEKVEYRNVVCLHQWCLDNPDAMVNNHEKNLLRDKIYLQTLLGDPTTREKVVRNIAKEVALDREAIMLQFGRK